MFLHNGLSRKAAVDQAFAAASTAKSARLNALS